MFNPTDMPRLFALPPGVDFSHELVAGLRARLAGQPPEAMARVTLIVNTRRMARRIREIFDAGPASFLPRIGTVTSLDALWPMPTVAPALPSLRRKLELAQLVSALLDREEGLAPRSALFDLADSLSALMDEMHGEGVGMDAIEALDISDQSGHWARLKSFLSITAEFDNRTEAAGAEARTRKIVSALLDQWASSPPKDPVILAGSTGSRGTTQMLLRAVSDLPQGAVILPGYDLDMPSSAWAALDGATGAEDHPQYRFRTLHHALDIAPDAIPRWTDTSPVSPSRNAVLSMALRPAPVTDQWRVEGPELTGIKDAMQNVTLLEAPSRRIEALTIAMRLRDAAEAGTPTALITPDRDLTRQVAAALDRWRIVPDDSAGTPLHLTAPGRFLRHVAALGLDRLSTEALLTLLKHPLTHRGTDRGPHLRLTRELELYLRKEGLPFPTSGDLAAWAEKQDDPFTPAWTGWLRDTLFADAPPSPRPLTECAAAHTALAMRIAWGAESEPEWPETWEKDDGLAARATLAELALQAPHGGNVTAMDFANLLDNLLSSGEWRATTRTHPLIRIWGTLEARVQGAELVILAGLNEGSWPEVAGHDPWLNRALRKQAGLLLPERRIGLAAHDFQQAALAPEVWLTRSVRSDEAQTVVSRWLNRLQNLLAGLPDQGGKAALDGMRERGAHWLSLAKSLEDTTLEKPAPRPAPCPPVETRPSRLSVTSIRHLIRDPYAIYARDILRLMPLNAVQRTADPMMRGIAIHEILEQFVIATKENDDALTREAFFSIADPILAQSVPWSQVQLQWRVMLERVADSFLHDETGRRITARPTALEARGSADFAALGFTLTAKADRIDLTGDGRIFLFDYKTGAPPSAKEQEFFEKQLLLEAAMAERGAFDDLAPAPVVRAAYIGLGSKSGEADAPLEKFPPERTWSELSDLISAYQNPDQGYVARRAMNKTTDQGNYDQLSRFGEWDTTTAPTLIKLELPDG